MGVNIKRINQKVGFHLVIKFGSMGVVNLPKAIPLEGSITGSVFDGVTTNNAGNAARKIFIE